MVGGPGKGVYGKIKNSSKGKCLFCTHGTPTTLDHYLPQSVPELSILPLNLIPCCSGCNNKKGELVAKCEEQHQSQ